MKTTRKMVQASVQSADELRWSAFDNLIEGCQVISNDWRYLYLNHTALQQARQPKEKLIGRTMMECFPGIETTEMFDTLRYCMETRIPYTLENEFTFPDGATGWFELRFEPVPEGIFILSLDITERKRSAESLIRLQRAITNSHDSVFMTDAEGNITYINPAFETLYGYTAKEVIGKNPRILKSGKNPKQLYNNFWATLLSGNTFKSEMVNKTKDGRFVEIETEVDPFFDNQNRLTGFIAIQRDVTERKRAEVRIQHLARLYATLSQVNQTIVRVTDREELFRSICKVAVEYGKFELAWIGVVDSKTGNITPAAVHGTAQNNIPFQNINYKEPPFKDGLIGKAIVSGNVAYCKDIQDDPTMLHWREMAKKFDFHSSAVIPFKLDHEVIGFVKLYSTDIDFFESTEQHNLLKEMSLDVSFALQGMKREKLRSEAENALRQSEELFSKTFHSSPVGIAISRLSDGKFIDVNDEACKIYGYTREQLVGRTSNELGLLPADVRKKLLDTLQFQGRLTAAEVTLHTGTGEDRSVLFSWEPVEIAGESCAIASIVDITERKRTEEERTLLASRNQVLVHALGEIIYEWYPSKEELRWDGEYTKILGYTSDEIGTKTKDWESRIHPDDKEKVWRELERAVQEHKTFEVEYRFLHRDGKYRWMYDRGILYVNNEGKLERVYGVFRDITEQRKLEEQLLRNQRMESVGTLAGGIAHDLNNILAPILLALQILRKSASDAQTIQILDMLESTAHRGAALIKQILTFARGTEGERTFVQLKYSIDELKKFVQNTFPANITINTEVPNELWTIHSDPTQIHQVLLNLAVNARDAMPHGGAITVVAENVMLDEHYAAMNVDCTPGPHVKISIRDTGSGIPAEIQQKIFEPFFTTKETGKGTGLGLATVYSIVKSHRGFINLYSEPGRGTTFNLYFPSGAGEKEIKETHSEVEFLQGNGECILLVDDECVLREVFKQTLEASGYKILLAADGIEAVSLIAQNLNTVDLVITDLNMPNMDGQTLVRTLQKMKPSLPIIATSGLADSERLAELSKLHLAKFLPKPYTAGRLMKSIAEVLKKGSQ